MEQSERAGVQPFELLIFNFPISSYLLQHQSAVASNGQTKIRRGLVLLIDTFQHRLNRGQKRLVFGLIVGSMSKRMPLNWAKMPVWRLPPK